MAIDFSARQEIVNDEELKEAVMHLYQYFHYGGIDEDYMDNLANLISKYKNKHYNMDKRINTIDFSLKKEILNDEEFEQAIDQLEKVFCAPKGTIEGDKAEHLVKLIADYDDKHYPIEKPIITVNDLKVGNVLVYDTGQDGVFPTRIDWQDIKHASEDLYCFIDNHSPLELTIDLLLKIGFWKNPYTDHYMSIQCANFRVFENDDDSFYLYGTDIMIEIKYLHELQNLYYAMIKQELDVSKLFEDV